jgi:hypothetical protein
MPEFCSDAWLDALDRAVRGSARVAQLGPIVIEQIVTDVPGRGVVRYRLVVDDHGGRIEQPAADAPAADLRLTIRYDAAAVIAAGHESAQTALARGDVRLGGDLDLLATRSAAFAALSDVAVELRATTTYSAS